MKDHLDSDSLADSEFRHLLVECLEKIERGETLDREALTREHPQYAELLGEFLVNQELLKEIALGIRDAGEGISDPSNQPTMDSASPSREFELGDSIRYIGEYEILAEIARGGMGVVFKARQQSLKRIVALKMILAGRLADSSNVERFRREARAAGRLNHPNIVPIHEIGEFEGRHYFTMEFVDGPSLAKSIRDETLAPRAAAALLRETAQAVQYAHEQGTVHRDLKPANILLKNGKHPQITDFGLAKWLESVDEESRTELTASGQILGTPSYMSPEQASGKQALVGPAADIYSLGAILYACLTGRAPFVADSPVDTLMQVLSKDPVPPRTLNPSVPRDLETIGMKCLHKEPHRRYGTAQELANDLQRFLEGRPVRARPISGLAKLHRWARRNRMVASLIAVCAMTLVGGTVVSSYFAIVAERRADSETVQRKRADEAAGIAQQARRDMQNSLIHEAAARDAAEAATRRADERSKQLHRQLYVAHIPQAHRAWQEGNVIRMRQLLQQHVPESGQQDLRGFEWNYLWNLADSARLTMQTGRETFHAVVDPEGHWVATTGRGRIEVRDLDTGARRNVFDVEWGVNSQIAVDPTGRFLVGGRDTLTMWDLETDNAVWTVNDNDRAMSLDFAVDGTVLVEKRGDWKTKVWTIRVRDATSGEVVRNIPVPSQIFGVAVNHAGTRMAASCLDHVVRIWDVRTGTLLHEWPDIVIMNALTFSPDDRWIAGGGRQLHIDVRDAESGKLLFRLGPLSTDVVSLVFDEDGRHLAYGGSSQIVHVIDIQTKKVTSEFRGTPAALVDIVYRPSSSQIVSCDLSGQINVRDLHRKQGMLEIHGISTHVTDAEFGPHGQWLATSQAVLYRPSLPGTVQLWNIQTGEAGPIVETRDSGVFGVAFQNDGRRLASVGEDGQLVLHDVETLEVVKTLETGSRLRSVDLSPDGRLAIVGTEDGKVEVWNVEAGQVAATLTLDAAGTVHCVAMSPLGHSIVAANPWRFCVWQWPSKKELCVIKRAGIRCAAFDAEGKRVAVGIDGHVQIYETQDWQRIGEFSAHSQPLHRLAFSPSGNRLATRADDGTLKVWDLESLQRLLVLKLSDAQLNEHFAPRFSPDETLLLGDRIGDRFRLFTAPNPQKESL